MCRYSKRYEKLIDHYKNTFVEGFVEKHHIVPLCLGGEDVLDNLIALPPRAHYLAHYFLWKANPCNSKLAHAFAMMAVNNPYQHRIMNGKLYELSKIARSKALKGKKLSEETKQKMRKPKSQQHREKLRGNKNAKGNKGKKYGPRSLEHTANLVASQRRYQEKRSKENKEKVSRLREEFILSEMNRRQFAEIKGISYPTMKRYLSGFESR
jgi:hypothetical protein